MGLRISSRPFSLSHEDLAHAEAGMKRILVVGCSGSGKTRFSLALAERLGLPVIHLDQHYWKPGWVETDRETWRGIVKELAARDEWIMDGTYSGTFDLRMPRADAILYFEISRWICLWRVLQRHVRTGRGKRADMADGCPERMDVEFYRYIWTFKNRFGPLVERALQAYGGGKKIFRIRGSEESDAAFLSLVHAR